MDKKEFRKSTKLEIEKRIDECIDTIMTGHKNYSMFCEWFITTYDMSKHNAHKYWVKCWDIIKSRFALEQDQLISKQIYELYDLYKQAKDLGDFTNSRKILEDIRKIQGIEQPEKLNIKHEGTITVSFGDETN